jgi:hypothetical protein
MISMSFSQQEPTRQFYIHQSMGQLAVQVTPDSHPVVSGNTPLVTVSWGLMGSGEGGWSAVPSSRSMHQRMTVVTVLMTMMMLMTKTMTSGIARVMQMGSRSGPVCSIGG